MNKRQTCLRFDAISLLMARTFHDKLRMTSNLSIKSSCTKSTSHSLPSSMNQIPITRFCRFTDASVASPIVILPEIFVLYIFKSTIV